MLPGAAADTNTNEEYRAAVGSAPRVVEKYPGAEIPSDAPGQKWGRKLSWRTIVRTCRVPAVRTGVTTGRCCRHAPESDASPASLLTTWQPPLQQGDLQETEGL